MLQKVPRYLLFSMPNYYANCASLGQLFSELQKFPAREKQPAHHGHNHGQALPCCLILYAPWIFLQKPKQHLDFHEIEVCALAILCGFLVSGPAFEGIVEALLDSGQLS